MKKKLNMRVIVFSLLFLIIIFMASCLPPPDFKNPVDPEPIIQPYSLNILSVSATGHDGNLPKNTLDNDLSTRWSDEGIGVWIMYDLGKVYEIHSINISWYKGDLRQAFFDVQYSVDGTSWGTAFSGSSSGNILDAERYGVTKAGARYVRIVGKGNTEHNWTSITTVTIIGLEANENTTFLEIDPNPLPPKMPSSECGNNIIESGEECDDGNDNGKVCYPPQGGSCNYCSNTCSIVTIKDTPTNSPSTITLGPQPVSSTPLSQGTRFASPSGSGTSCTQTSPCTMNTAISGARAGDVVFLRGGTYSLSSAFRVQVSGTSSNPLIIESYPGERAVIDGNYIDETRFSILSNYVHLRNLDVTRMTRSGGVYVGGNYNLMEGVHAYNNRASGFMISHMSYPLEGSQQPYYVDKGSYNIIRNCIAHSNSDVDTSAAGGNADGISVPSGEGNVVMNCLVYNNSDDGIDTWRSINTLVAFNIVHSNGYGPSGNGMGVKAGGPWPSNGTIVMHTISYNNKNVGFTQNSGAGVKFYYVTSYNNGRSFWTETDSNKPRDAIIEKSIAAGLGTTQSFGGGTMIDNSWQRSGTVSFISTNPSSPDFLRPTATGGFADIGAYAPSPYKDRIKAPFN